MFNLRRRLVALTTSLVCVGACSSTSSRTGDAADTLKITWAATGADSVYVAIDNKDGIDAQDLPLNGSYELSFNCGGTHTYWVVAVKGSAKDCRSTTFP